MRMKRTSLPLEEVIPVMSVKDGCIISRRGEVTVGWEVSLPSMYGISEDEYDDIISSFSASMRILPFWTIVHRQDVFTYDVYEAEPCDSYLRDSYEAHFDGRRFLKHRQFLYLTMSSKGSILKPHSATAAFGIRFDGKTPHYTQVREFIAKADEFAVALGASGRLKLRRLSQTELEGEAGRNGLLDDYLNLYQDSPLLSDIPMAGDYIQVGECEVLGFAISEAEDMQGEISSVGRVEPLCGPASEIIVSSGTALGAMLDCEHIVNQFIVIPQQSYILSDLDRKRKKMVSMSKNAENRVNAEEIGNYLDDVHRDSLTSVLAHMNVIAWGHPDEIDAIRGKVSSALTMSGITAVQAKHGLPVLWLSGMPGAAAELGKQNLMVMELESALCMGIYDTFEKDMPGGLFRICDRFRNIPLSIDVQKIARDRGHIDNYNAFVLGPSGTGKSFFMNYYLRNCYDAGEEIFIIDVGDSYEGLCEIIREESGGKDGIYHSWDTDHPFCFNPFDGYEDWLGADGTSLKMDSTGATFFLSFLQTLWSPVGGWTSSTTPVLRQTVVDFVTMALGAFAETGTRPVFDDYYKFLKVAVSPAIEAEMYMVGDEPVGMNRFDIKDFRLSLIPYAKGGEFSFLLNDPCPKDLFSSRFTVFEVDMLSQVEDKKFYSLCVLCIMNAFDQKMRRSRKFKIMVIEEAWKAIANETMAPYLKGLWKTARKFQTSAMVVTQEIGDVTSSEVIKDAILNNSAVKFLLNQTSNQNNFGLLTELLGLGPKEKNLILSMDRANNNSYRYREVFIKWNNRCGVYATEASPQEALAYESDKVKKKPVHALAAECGSLRDAITRLTED